RRPAGAGLAGVSPAPGRRPRLPAPVRLPGARLGDPVGPAGTRTGAAGRGGGPGRAVVVGGRRRGPEPPRRAGGGRAAPWAVGVRGRRGGQPGGVARLLAPAPGRPRPRMGDKAGPGERGRLLARGGGLAGDRSPAVRRRRAEPLPRPAARPPGRPR